MSRSVLSYFPGVADAIAGTDSSFSSAWSWKRCCGAEGNEPNLFVVHLEIRAGEIREDDVPLAWAEVTGISVLISLLIKSNFLTSPCRENYCHLETMLYDRAFRFALHRIRVIERIAAPDCSAPADQEAHLSSNILFGVAISITPLARDARLLIAI